MDSNEIDLMAELPKPTMDSRPFWEGCNEEKLLLQRCAGCQNVFYYARRLCPSCGGGELAWEPSAGRGCVYSLSEVHVPFQGPAWASQVPYTVLLVDLDEGPRMLSRWLGPAGSPPKIRQRVRACFPAVGGQKLPFFRAEES